MFVNAIAAKIGKPFLAALLKNSLLDWVSFCFSILFVLGYTPLSSSGLIKCVFLKMASINTTFHFFLHPSEQPPEQVPLQLPLHPLQLPPHDFAHAASQEALSQSNTSDFKIFAMDELFKRSTAPRIGKAFFAASLKNILLP